MKNILRSGAVLAFVLGVAGAGCGGKAGEAIADMKKIKDKMCACKDAACVAKVSEDMAKLNEKHKDTKATESQMKEAMKIAGEIAKCSEKAMGDMGAGGGGGGAAPADPAAGGGTAAPQ